MTDKQKKMMKQWKRNPHEGLLIAIEGIDGSGKTTLARELGRYYRNNNVAAIRTREPYGEELRAALKAGEIKSREEVNERLIEDRKTHYSEFIEPALKEGYTVITDRYVGSQVAYQGRTQGEMFAIANVNFTNVPMSDVTIWVDTPPELAWQRILERGKIDKNESEDELNRVYDNYYLSIQYTTRHLEHFHTYGQYGSGYEYQLDDICRNIEVFAGGSGRMKLGSIHGK